ncbi:MAG: COX15/CtaA family protein [Thermaerobacter sp.]|nr:COX15/CtaA family protein [Thermaerobacter sp.]
MHSPRPEMIRRFAAISSLLIFGLIILGGVVTASESGLGCGAHWPLCHGQVIPPDTFHAWVEWTHRLIAGLVSLMIVVLNGLIWRGTGMRDAQARRLRWLGIVALGLLVAQVLLGAAIVFNNLAAVIVAIHLGTALLLMDVLVAIVVLARPVRLRRKTGGVGAALWWLAGLSEATAIMGSYVAHAVISSACDGFSCLTGGLLGGAGVPLLVHVTLALSLAVVLGILFKNRRLGTLSKTSRTYLTLALFLFMVQVLVGLVMLGLNVPDPLLALHESIGSGVAVSFFMAALYQQLAPVDPDKAASASPGARLAE